MALALSHQLAARLLIAATAHTGMHNRLGIGSYAYLAQCETAYRRRLAAWLHILAKAWRLAPESEKRRHLLASF